MKGEQKIKKLCKHIRKTEQQSVLKKNKIKQKKKNKGILDVCTYISLKVANFHVFKLLLVDRAVCLLSYTNTVSECQGITRNYIKCA